MRRTGSAGERCSSSAGRAPLGREVLPWRAGCILVREEVTWLEDGHLGRRCSFRLVFPPPAKSTLWCSPEERAAVSSDAECLCAFLVSTDLDSETTWLLLLPYFHLKAKTPVVGVTWVLIFILIMSCLVNLGRLLLFHCYIRKCPHKPSPRWPPFVP